MNFASPMRIFLFGVITFLAMRPVMAQGRVSGNTVERCTSYSLTQRWLQEQGLSPDVQRALRHVPKGTRKGGGSPTIPVAVHVVWNTPPENVATSVIQNMIATMNEDYQALNSDWNDVRAVFADDEGDPDVLFCLAQVDANGNMTTGITRTQTSQTWFDPETETDVMKSAPDGIAPWDPDHYLNIWICDISSGLGGGLTISGYTYLPVGNMVGSNVDGIVIDYHYGLVAGARTATHEAGHYLGLDHPWADGGCGSDDGMNDTPVTDGPTYTCANTALMHCGELTQYENFMDYASCALMFTHDQSAFMNAVLFGVRSSLLDNDACSTVITGPCIPASQMGTGDGDYVDGVVLGSIDNTNTGSTAGAIYQDYTAQSTDLIRGNSYTLTATSGEYEQDIMGAWIDYDADDLFQAGELLGETITTATFEQVEFNFTVPGNATLGSTRLRVRCMGPAVGEPTNADPCFSFTWGETEDYSVVIEANVGLPIMASSSGVTVVPDPADRILGIHHSNDVRWLDVLDLSGRVVMHSPARSVNETLDVSGLSNGRYLLRTTAAGDHPPSPFTVLHSR